MFSQYKILLVTLLVIIASVDLAAASDEVSAVSWIFRGTAQQNNTVLTFNMYDTLNLICRATGEDEPREYFTFAITRGASAPTNMTIYDGAYDELTVSDPGTMVWNDFDGILPGFENFLIIPDGTPDGNSYDAQYAFRNVHVGTLMPADAGTYHCSVCYEEGGDPDYLGTSGGLTIVVNTKLGQARSSRGTFSSILTYSAVIMGASKLIF